MTAQAIEDEGRPRFRTPEEVAPELGMTKTELRRYCKESGIYTELSKRRITLDTDNINDLIAWVKQRKAEPVKTEAGEINHFA